MHARPDSQRLTQASHSVACLLQSYHGLLAGSCCQKISTALRVGVRGLPNHVPLSNILSETCFLSMIFALQVQFFTLALTGMS